MGSSPADKRPLVMLKKTTSHKSLAELTKTLPSGVSHRDRDYKPT